MRVTAAMREYVRKAVLAKVAGKIEAAEKAAKAAEAARTDKFEEAEALCERLRAEAQAKFVKEVKKLGLTFIPDSYWNGKVKDGGNVAIRAGIELDDFVETITMASRDSLKAKCNPCAEREKFYELLDEPERIREAAKQAADKLLFELELGKVAKKELDETLNGLEVKL